MVVRRKIISCSRGSSVLSGATITGVIAVALLIVCVVCSSADISGLICVCLLCSCFLSEILL